MNKDNAASAYWTKLNAVRRITGAVTLTPEQFKKQLDQAVRFGFKEGHGAGVKTAMDLEKIIGRKDNLANDFLNGLFGL